MIARTPASSRCGVVFQFILGEKGSNDATYACAHAARDAEFLMFYLFV